MKKHYLLYIFLLFWAGCTDSPKVTDALQRAETLMNEHPDSALTILRSIGSQELKTGSTRARYALLYSQALDKNYIDETNDSLINIAVDYYKNGDNVPSKFLSYYYKGRVHTNAAQYLRATSCYMEAKQLADAVDDGYLTGLLYAELGKIYCLYYDYPKSLEAYQEAADRYERSGKIRHRNFTWYNLSSVYRNMNKHDDAERLLHQTLDAAQEAEDRSLVEWCIGSLVMLYVEQGRMQEARTQYEGFLQQVETDDASASLMGSLAEVYAVVGDPVRAKAVLEEGWLRAKNRNDSINLYVSASRVYHQENKGESAYQELLKGMSLQTSEALQALQQPILTAQRDYLSEKLDFETYRFETEKKIAFLSVLLLLSLLALSLFVFRWIIRKNREKFRLLISELQRGKEEVEQEKERMARENRKISSLLQQMEQSRQTTNRTIESLKEEIGRSEENRLEMAGLLQTLQAEQQKKDLQMLELLMNNLTNQSEWILLHEEKWTKEQLKYARIREKVTFSKKTLLKNNEDFDRLESLVNACYGNVMLHFREEVKLASETDYRRVCCMFAKMPPYLIALVMGETKDVVYKRKSRLLKYIEAYSCVHKELFIRSIG